MMPVHTTVQLLLDAEAQVPQLTTPREVTAPTQEQPNAPALPSGLR